MRDLSALDGRELAVSLNAGEITVLVPEGLNVDVDADIRYAGEISVDGSAPRRLRPVR